MNMFALLYLVRQKSTFCYFTQTVRLASVSYFLRCTCNIPDSVCFCVVDARTHLKGERGIILQSYLFLYFIALALASAFGGRFALLFVSGRCMHTVEKSGINW